MAGIETDPLILPIIARTDQMVRAVRGAKAQFSTETDQIKRASAVMRKQLEADSVATGTAFKRMAGAIAGYFSGRELVNITNAFTTFQNSLRVAGVASEDLGAVQERLFATAQKYGVEIVTLGSLFGTLTNASKELGASQEQIFQLTDVVSASLRVSGQSATEASGALMQLGQALRGGRVQAEEYNSLLDGMFPLLEAAAAGSARWGGSVAKLTDDVRAGKVASQELFGAILEGSQSVIKRAEVSTLSLSSAYTQLTNALTVYIGQAAQSSGAQAALVAGIGKIADNLDTLIPALALVGAALGVKYVVSAGAATLATLRTDAALLGLTTRAEIAGFAIGALARSLAINGALLAVTAAVAGLAGEIATTDALIKQANTSYDEMRKRLDAAGEGAKAAGDGSRGVGDGAASAEPKVRSFAGAVGDLADQLYRQAKAARAAKVEMLSKRLAESQSSEVELGRRTREGRNAEQADFRRGDFLNNLGIIGRNFTGDARRVLSGGRTDREAQDAYEKQVAVSRDLQRQLREANSAPLASYIDTPRPTPAPAPTGGRPRPTTGGGGQSTAQTAEQRREAEQRAAAEIAAAQIGYLQELANSTASAAERAALDQKIIEEMRKAAEQELRNNEALGKTERDKLIEINNQVAGLRKQQVVDREAERLRQEQLSIVLQSLRDEDVMLQRQAQVAQTVEERRRIELRRVDIAHQIERAQLKEELAQAEIAKDTARIAAARKRIADLDTSKPLDQDIARQATETPFERYRRELGDPKTQVQDAVVQKLNDVSDGITDAIAGFIGTKDPFLKSLIKILIDQVLMRPIADALAKAGGAGGGAGGFFGSLLSAAGAIFGRASGGYVAPGQTVRVNEQAGGVELLKMGAQGGKVIPLGQARAQRGGGGVVIRQTVNVDARGVTPERFAEHIVGAVRQETIAIVELAQKSTLKKVPVAMASFSQDTG